MVDDDKTPWRKTTFWQTADRKEAHDFRTEKTTGKCLLITYSFFPEFAEMLTKKDLSKTLLVVDEVHNIGSEKNRELMSIDSSDRELITSEQDMDQLFRQDYSLFENQYSKFRYRLGLSATPFSEYEEERNQFICDAFVNKKIDISDTDDWEDEIIKERLIFDFDLKQAIRKKILCPMNYKPLEYTPSKKDREKKQSVFRAWMRKVEEGEASKQSPYIMAANVYKDSLEKIPVFLNFLEENPNFFSDGKTVIFVNTKKYGRRIAEIVSERTRRYHTFFSGDKEELLEIFEQGGIDILITCHMISEGIDVPAISNVVLFSSDRQRRETIQRMGRALRFDSDKPDKRANVIDFVYLEPDKDESADIIRRGWLTELSRIDPDG
jgi:superfamily II DNA or RNA helicase